MRYLFLFFIVAGCKGPVNDVKRDSVAVIIKTGRLELSGDGGQSFHLGIALLKVDKSGNIINISTKIVHDDSIYWGDGSGMDKDTLTTSNAEIFKIQGLSAH